MNNKEKVLAIKSLITETIRRSKIYILDFKITKKTKDLVKKLIPCVDTNLRNYLVEPKNKKKNRNKLGPCIIGDQINKVLKGYPSIIKMDSNFTDYHLFYKGFTFRRSFLTTKKDFLEFLEQNKYISEETLEKEEHREASEEPETENVEDLKDSKSRLDESS